MNAEQPPVHATPSPEDPGGGATPEQIKKVETAFAELKRIFAKDYVFAGLGTITGLP